MELLGYKVEVVRKRFQNKIRFRFSGYKNFIAKWIGTKITQVTFKVAREGCCYKFGLFHMKKALFDFMKR
jgi:hypothetical protein